jgi:hypothetical protein
LNAFFATTDPVGVVTVTSTCPTVNPVGTVAVILVAEETVKLAAVAANLTPVAPVKSVPVMVTVAPAAPVPNPPAASTPEMVGEGTTVAFAAVGIANWPKTRASAASTAVSLKTEAEPGWILVLATLARLVDILIFAPLDFF